MNQCPRCDNERPEHATLCPVCEWDIGPGSPYFADDYGGDHVVFNQVRDPKAIVYTANAFEYEGMSSSMAREVAHSMNYAHNAAIELTIRIINRVLGK